MKYPWETWNLVPNQLAAGTLSTLRWEPCLHQRRLSWLCNRKFLKGNCMMIIMVILEFFFANTDENKPLVLTVVGPKRLATSQMVDDQQNWVWPLHSSRCAIESRNKSLVKSVDPMAHKPIPISGGALLNWSGWVLGPWDLRISPNFYSCFQ